MARAKAKPVTIAVLQAQYRDPSTRARAVSVNRALEARAIASQVEINQEMGLKNPNVTALDAGANPLTLARRRRPPLETMRAGKHIGPEEFRAAEAIATVWFVLTSGLWIKPLNMEKRDKGYGSYESQSAIDEERRYRAWATALAGKGVLPVVIDAIVEEHPFTMIEQIHTLAPGNGMRTVKRGLRDYAARAGWVSHNVRNKWLMG
jgi:hypothetical protein